MAKDARPEIPQQLLDLQRAEYAQRAAATTGPYTQEGWRAWLDPAEAVQAAVTAHAATAGGSRYELEMAAKKGAREADEVEV